MDIVERLEKAANSDRYANARQLKLDAKIEIERLRHNEAFHVERAAAQDVEIERLRAELAMERLRATLVRADLAAEQGAEERG